ncbi:sulfotransferase family 2 domain-containing protein [Thioalkalivibrio sp. ALgr1]|uniref:sulfotransferase family 2 domain-containing protein n=1 Tax=Thioalkalivibrio sp. ALgr1 TaxID=748655 RepID=UPI0012E99697|nr:sulfotransferase family 2 domain-containing protein [Thioalkalivibrio sp. ALgr1]
MIISHEHKYIFMHGRKCAGSSIEVMLNQTLGPQDIQIGSWSESLAAGGRINRKALVDACGSPLRWPLVARLALSSVKKFGALDIGYVANGSIKKKYINELGPNASCPPAESVKKFDPVTWEKYFKFSFTRNPFEFEVSDYWWRAKRCHAIVSFKEFLRRKADRLRSDPEGLVPFPESNWMIYSINDEVALDFVGRYETLSSDLMEVGMRIGISLDGANMPNAKSGHRKNLDPKSLYDGECVSLVERIHSRELETFGYEFPY